MGLLLTSIALHAIPGSSAQADSNRAKSLVVMINGKLNGEDKFGAGVIFAEQSNRVYIATARHVVWDEKTRATDVRVKFAFLPGEGYDARVLDDQDRNLDLAVLAVQGSGDAQIPSKSIPFEILGDATALKHGAGLYSIGYPAGKAWGMNIDPDRFDELGGTEIKFQSNFVRGGDSGGGLFDEHFNLVGMIVKDEPPDAVAHSINSVLAKLKEWRYPADLKLSGAAASSTSPDPGKQSQVETKSAPVERTGTIKVVYAGDFFYCSLLLDVKIGKKSFRPVSNNYTVRDVALGKSDYTISGNITCPTGYCTASGSGSLDIHDGGIYSVVWSNTGYAQCTVALIEVGLVPAGQYAVSCGGSK